MTTFVTEGRSYMENEIKSVSPIFTSVVMDKISKEMKRRESRRDNLILAATLTVFTAILAGVFYFFFVKFGPISLPQISAKSITDVSMQPLADMSESFKSGIRSSIVGKNIIWFVVGLILSFFIGLDQYLSHLKSNSDSRKK